MYYIYYIYYIYYTYIYTCVCVCVYNIAGTRQTPYTRSLLQHLTLDTAVGPGADMIPLIHGQYNRAKRQWPTPSPPAALVYTLKRPSIRVIET